MSDCEKLEKKEARLRVDIDKILSSERETCHQLKINGTAELQEFKKSWRQTEENDLKRRVEKLSPKLKRDAAKSVEPKLRELMELNAEELSRLQRQSNRDIDCYRLELFSKMNRDFKQESEKIRKEERQRQEQLESEWMQKLEEVRTRNCAEIDKTIKEHEQRMQMQNQHFSIDKQRLTHDHQAHLEDARQALNFEMEQVTIDHEREMTSIQSKHQDNISRRRDEMKM